MWCSGHRYQVWPKKVLWAEILVETKHTLWWKLQLLLRSVIPAKFPSFTHDLTCFPDFHNDVSRLEFWSSCLASGGSLQSIKIHVLLHFLYNFFLSLFKTFTEIWLLLNYSLWHFYLLGFGHFILFGGDHFDLQFLSWIFNFSNHNLLNFFFFWCRPFLKSLLNLFHIASVVYVLVFWPQGMWDLSHPIRDQTHTSCIGRQSLNDWTTRDIS